MAKLKRGRRDAAATVRLARAMQLRIQGLTYQQIADECGYADRQSAWNAVQGELARTAEEPNPELRNLEVMRLDALLAAVWPEATHQPEPLDGSEDEDEAKRKRRGASLFAIDRALMIMERRAKLLALDRQPADGGMAGVIVVRQYGGLNPAEV